MRGLLGATDLLHVYGNCVSIRTAAPHRLPAHVWQLRVGPNCCSWVVLHRYLPSEKGYVLTFDSGFVSFGLTLGTDTPLLVN
jgi:hypothetical protein